jgi:RNA polymerase sigma-70 factor (ECF subfamily)
MFEKELDTAETISTPLASPAARGSGCAFEEFVVAHQLAIRWYVARHVRDATVADDLAQEVFLCAYRHMAERGELEKPRAWLIGVARHLTLQYFRTEARRQRREQHPFLTQLAVWRAERLEAEVTDVYEGESVPPAVVSLRECLGKLGLESRQLVQAYYYQRESLESVARRQNRTAGSIRMMLLRIRTALGKCVRDQLRKAESD